MENRRGLDTRIAVVVKCVIVLSSLCYFIPYLDSYNNTKTYLNILCRIL
jgi:hypothetical protein